MPEQVLVFDEAKMEGFKNLPGFSADGHDIAWLRHECLSASYFVNRKVAEKDPTKKQIIPYILIGRGNKILTYLRSKKSGEERLHDLWSVGIGGHVNITDQTAYNSAFVTLSAAIGRELEEELDWGNMLDCTVNNIEEVGVLYDPSNEVGQVHIGYVMTIDLPADGSEFPKPHEDTIEQSAWYTAEEASKLANLESWSKIILGSMAK
jgi:predicted NUDIX family phosphoesterase